MYNTSIDLEIIVNEATVKALIAYLEALKADGMTSVHLCSVIPTHTMTSFQRRQAGLPSWTQFPELPTLPEGMAYDRSSGFVYFDMELFARVQPY
jgi:hypothetical protein